jgi:hypothetical protein
MRKPILHAVLAAGLLVGAPALAHEGGKDARGVVKTITSQELVVTTTGGVDLKVAIVGDTEILRGTKSVPARDVHPGERVVVHAAPREGRLEAGLVNLAAKHK